MDIKGPTTCMQYTICCAHYHATAWWIDRLLFEDLNVVIFSIWCVSYVYCKALVVIERDIYIHRYGPHILLGW